MRKGSERKRSSPLKLARQVLHRSKEHCGVSTRDIFPTFWPHAIIPRRGFDRIESA
jgi:hypothetical protein